MCVRTFAVVCWFAMAIAPAAANDEPFRSQTPPQDDAVEEGAAEMTSVEDAAAGMTNDDIIEMVRAGLGHSTIIAAIRLNPALFDVSPRGLVALAHAGVPETVVEVMLEAEAANRRATGDVAPPAAAAGTEGPPNLAAEVTPPEAHSGSWEDWPGGDSPRAWILNDGGKGPLDASTAQVAFTEARSGPAALSSLQNLAGSAFSFVSPALGLASGLGSVFRSGDPTVTVVWALPGPSSSRVIDRGAAFEIEFAAIPGVNPDRYQPVVVRLIPTPDNFRLVGAARTRASTAGALPDGDIIEESVPAELTRLGRGHYRIDTSVVLTPGEYALVLRPMEARERERRWRRNTESSLSELMGGQSAQVLYTTWDFSIRP